MYIFLLSSRKKADNIIILDGSDIIILYICVYDIHGFRSGRYVVVILWKCIVIAREVILTLKCVTERRSRALFGRRNLVSTVYAYTKSVVMVVDCFVFLFIFYFNAVLFLYIYITIGPIQRSKVYWSAVNFISIFFFFFHSIK